jgi:hypothetical protein
MTAIMKIYGGYFKVVKRPLVLSCQISETLRCDDRALKGKECEFEWRESVPGLGSLNIPEETVPKIG